MHVLLTRISDSLIYVYSVSFLIRFLLIKKFLKEPIQPINPKKTKSPKLYVCSTRFLAPWSPYWTHLKEAWALKDHPNLLFIFYEDMQLDFLKVIKKVAKFLGKTYTDEKLNKVADYLNIKNFRNNPMVNGSELKDCGIIKSGSFIRKGSSGGWRDFFTPEITARADKWIEANLKNTDLHFPCFNN